MHHILIVEDSIFFGKLLLKKFSEESPFHPVWVKTKAEALIKIQEAEQPFLAAILDFNLPDAPAGEIIDPVVDHGIPSIIYTGSVSEDIRKLVWTKKVVDYVIKNDLFSIEYIIGVLTRLEKNSGTKILVVEDSKFFRKVVSDLLIIHRYQVLNASNGVEALEVLGENPDIKLVLTDFNMPEMDGFALTQKIREQYKKDQLAIIGISSNENELLAANFIKSGANDFIIKQSFLTEEFYCRITQAIELLEHIHALREASIKDFLTKLYNRRYFFDAGNKMHALAKRQNHSMVCAMMDIDHFKSVNDTYGHDVGDLVLKQVSGILNNRMRESDIVARLGGEEFCVLGTNMDPKEAFRIFEDLRQQIENTVVDCMDGENKISVTISIGITTDNQDSIDSMTKVADGLLYQAKEGGRNRVIVDQTN